MIIKGLSVLFAGLLVSAAFAQEHCTSHTITERWLQAHGQQVDLAHEASLLEQQGVQRGGVQTVPVVVHVVWNNTAENVSDALVHSIIAEMNADYQAMNSDYNNVRSSFLASRGNAQIEFCLATTDASGNPTTGINRFQTSKTWFNPDTETDAMKYAPGGTPAWNSSKYLNIWICDISSGATGGYVTAGYAYLPVGGVVGTGYDGLVLDYIYGTSGRTATHEVGHYFGLPHPWGNGSCTPGDGISDTPATNSATFSCGNTNLMKCNTLTQYENFMDYSNCPVMFTNGQATVMNGVLNGVRSSLLTSSACSGGSGLCIPTSVVGTADGDFIDGVILETIQNVGTGSTTGPTYNDYTMQSATLTRGETYTLLITNGEYYEDMVAAWIDFNGNGQLSPDEMIGQVLSTGDFQIIPFEFTVPMTAVPGNTIMRVRAMYPDTDQGQPASPDPCINFTWGETEDYGIVISTSTAVVAQTAKELTVRTHPDHVEVSWPNATNQQHALMLDAAGRVLLELDATGNRLTIPTTQLAAGMYQLILNLDGERLVARFVVAGQ